MIALAYCNWGRWVADCPVPGCGDALAVAPGQAAMLCVKGHSSDLSWPDAATVVAIDQALAARPDESTRNWFPRGQPMAIAGGYPVDQTAKDLDAETQAMSAAAAERDERWAQLAALAADLGVTITTPPEVS